MLSDCGGRGLRPDPPSPTGVNLLPASRLVYVKSSVNRKRGAITYFHVRFQSTLKIHKRPFSSPKGFYCTRKPVKFRWKHFIYSDTYVYKAFHIIFEKLFLKWQVLAFSIDDQDIFLSVYFDKQSEIILDVWIFDSMIIKNFNCL